MLFINRENFILIFGGSLIPKYKLKIKNIVNCECIRNRLVLIYSQSEIFGIVDRNLLRIKIFFEEANEKEIKAAFGFLKKQISANE